MGCLEAARRVLDIPQGLGAVATQLLDAIDVGHIVRPAAMRLMDACGDSGFARTVSRRA